jgi:hypothetical protein
MNQLHQELLQKTKGICDSLSLFKYDCSYRGTGGLLTYITYPISCAGICGCPNTRNWLIKHANLSKIRFQSVDGVWEIRIQQ